MRFLKVGALFLLFIIFSCHSLPPDPTRDYRESLRSQMTELQPGVLPEIHLTYPIDGAFKDYWNRFSDAGPEGIIPWSWSTLEAGRHSLGILITPPVGTPRGIAVLFHGFLSHSGNFTPFIQYLRKGGWWVISGDLPGHGLSGGDIRGRVENTSEYGIVVESLMQWVNTIPEFQGMKRIGIGHSTGALSLFEYLQKDPGVFSKLVFGAPLIKTWLYGPSTIGQPLLSLFTSYISMGSSGDPLGVPYVPLNWFTSLVAWNQGIDKYKINTTPLLLVTGDQDSVVETNYNIPYLASKFPNSRVLLVPGLQHEVFQSYAYRVQVWKEVLQFIDN